jgi:uncharacterized protein YkwD
MRRVRPPTCVTVLAIALGVLAPATATAEPLPREISTSTASPQRVPSLEVEVLGVVNQFRAARGLRPFRSSVSLRAAAVRHSLEMGRLGYFSHASPSGAPFWRRIAWYYRSSGYREWAVGENLGYGSPSLTAAEVLRGWLASPPHRENVLSSWRDGGVGAVFVTPGPGVYDGLPTTIVTLDVGLRRR